MHVTGSRNTIPLSSIPPFRADPSEFARWRDYPVGAAGYNTITTSPSLSARLSNLGPILFSEEIKVHIINLENQKGDSTSD